jgi:hypothetical protein
MPREVTIPNNIIQKHSFREKKVELREFAVRYRYQFEQCCGSGIFIQDPGSEFFHHGSRIRIKDFKYFNPKNCFQALGYIIRVVHAGSGTGFFTHPGIKKAPDS